MCRAVSRQPWQSRYYKERSTSWTPVVNLLSNNNARRRESSHGNVESDRNVTPLCVGRFFFSFPTTKAVTLSSRQKENQVADCKQSLARDTVPENQYNQTKLDQNNKLGPIL